MLIHSRQKSTKKGNTIQYWHFHKLPSRTTSMLYDIRLLTLSQVTQPYHLYALRHQTVDTFTSYPAVPPLCSTTSDCWHFHKLPSRTTSMLCDITLLTLSQVTQPYHLYTLRHHTTDTFTSYSATPPLYSTTSDYWHFHKLPSHTTSILYDIRLLTLSQVTQLYHLYTLWHQTIDTFTSYPATPPPYWRINSISCLSKMEAILDRKIHTILQVWTLTMPGGRTWRGAGRRRSCGRHLCLVRAICQPTRTGSTWRNTATTYCTASSSCSINAQVVHIASMAGCLGCSHSLNGRVLRLFT